MKNQRSRSRSWVVENTWKCSSCGEKNRGRDMECTRCGSPKEKHEKYDTSGNLTAPPIIDPDVLELARSGKNWTCQYCGYENRNIKILPDRWYSCQRCGGTREHIAAAVVYEDEHDLSQSKIAPLCPTCGAETPPPCLCELPPEEMEFDLPSPEDDGQEVRRTFKGGSYREPPEVTEEPVEEFVPDVRPRDYTAWWLKLKVLSDRVKGLPKRAKTILGVVASLLVLAGMLTWVFMPHEVAADVSDTRWTHTRMLQQRRQNHGSGWDETVPGGAFDRHCSRRFRTTEQCNPHDCRCHSVTDYCSEECNCRDQCSTSCSDNGNGFSTCTESCTTVCSTCREPCGSHEECDTCWDECDVYDNWCEYEFYDWPTIDRETTSGHGPQTHWGSRLVADRSRHQRIEQRASYAVTFRRGDRSWETEPETLQQFRRYTPGDRWLIEVNYAGQIWPRYRMQ